MASFLEQLDGSSQELFSSLWDVISSDRKRARLEQADRIYFVIGVCKSKDLIDLDKVSKINQIVTKEDVIFLIQKISEIKNDPVFAKVIGEES